MRQLFLGVLMTLALGACASPQAQPAASDVEITLSRSVCFGFCPDYTVTINGAGDVRYEGRAFVNAVGVRTATIPSQDVARLIARFDAIGFERLRNEYRARITDIPTYTVSFTRDGHRKTVVDYGGTSEGMPEAVRALEDEIDRVAGTAQWVLRDGQPVRERVQP
ncbi:MAG: DUF6438 domain-containing protein [Hyphomonadaceae bacterium]